MLVCQDKQKGAPPYLRARGYPRCCYNSGRGHTSFRFGERRFLPRRIDQIVEVAGVEGRKLTLNPLFDGAGSDLRWTGSGPTYLDELEQAGFHVEL